MQNIIEVKPQTEKINWDTLTFLASFHVLSIPAFFMFSWQNLAALLIVNWISGSLGVGLGYHRLLTHRSFKAPKWLEYSLTVLGNLSMQGEPYKWVTTHRIHHQHTETDKDPHSTRPGAYWAHVGWVLYGTAQDHEPAVMKRYSPDLLKDNVHAWIARFYYVPLIASGVILFFIGGWSMVFWGLFLRVVFGWHSTWFVNSITQLWGKRRYETTDDSTNNFWIAILTFGEGWHNNHHAHPSSAQHGLAWYEFDQNWLTIKLFEKLGWAKQIRVAKIDDVPVKLKTIN
ncbi:MAG: fatty acid desaturase [Pyrinomonadaceae bacterium]|nr:fatty acid desaturase [Pyrinomonadaceae bacterium]